MSIEQDKVNANNQFRHLVTLHIRITLLSDVFATAGYAHGRAAIGLLQTLMNHTTPQVVTDLGSLHRASVWENIALKVGLQAKGIHVVQTPSPSPLERSPDRPVIELPEQNGAGAASGSNAPNGAADGPAETPPIATPAKEAPTKQETPREHNATALKHLTHGLPGALAPFFQGQQDPFIQFFVYQLLINSVL